MLYEKPNFKGEKIALDEGDIELTYPFNPEEELQNGEKEAGEPSGETSDVQSEPARRFIIGSLRRAVRVKQDRLTLSIQIVAPFSPITINYVVKSLFIVWTSLLNSVI